jgi:hypothetical protein
VRAAITLTYPDDRVNPPARIANRRSYARSCALMLKSHEVESLRRSQSMAPLRPGLVHELLKSCAQMARKREAILNVLSALPNNFGEVRKALNELHRIVASDRRPPTHRPGRPARHDRDAQKGYPLGERRPPSQTSVRWPALLHRR